MRYGRYGQFKALSNSPGVEFHINLNSDCALGISGQWFGWQCKFHERRQNGTLNSASRGKIESSLRLTEQKFPGISNWILWTPYTLSKTDQDWFYGLNAEFQLQLWSEQEVENSLVGDGLLLRSTYFGELILTPENLEEQHTSSIQPIRRRWLEPIHQPVDAERTIRRMLGESVAWEQMTLTGTRLKRAVDTISNGYDDTDLKFIQIVDPFIRACTTFADTLLQFHKLLANGDFVVIQQNLKEQKTVIDETVNSVPRRLRAKNDPIALNATNALDDMRIAQSLFDEVEEFLTVGLVAVLGDSGVGKTHLAINITAPQNGRSAGILLHGRYLQKGRTLNDLAQNFLINGNSPKSIEELVASLDAAGKRANCRLPVVIDGLNEAENPSDWKYALAQFGKVLEKYPNVLVVCTLRTGEHRRSSLSPPQFNVNARELFAVMALPDDVKKIEAEGFGCETSSAIFKYFKYFKINSGDVEIPEEFLQHPLTLRMYCEVINPTRKTQVSVDSFPASLSSLLEKFVANSCERISQMTNLEYSYQYDEVQSAIYKLGIELWTVGKREVDEQHFRGLVSDTMRSWNSSIVNILAQEGIIFRIPNGEPGQFYIVPAYDALGGYLVGSALLSKYQSDKEFAWLRKPEVKAQFSKKDSHHLASNIFDSLVVLSPARMHGVQLWKKAPSSLRKLALLYTTRLEARYIDECTVKALLNLFLVDPSAQKFLFVRLKKTRWATNHPFNTDFLGKALRKMTIAERDLSWTEWIRNSWECLDEILALERGWRDDVPSRSPSDRLRAKWVMWHLTSTHRELRDIATRALYWYGRGDPTGLFEECIDSLKINDPYIPERVLAASYGVAMALYVDINNQCFNNTELPNYSRRLYTKMFDIDAPFGTTHILMREYASRTIEIACVHSPQLFSDGELRRTKPLTNSCVQINWGEYDRAMKIRSSESPFRMDFENYTIGQLVPDRGNYNYDHEEYRKVRSQIYWRVKTLGWTSEEFSKIDDSIAGANFRHRVNEKATKTDRYGKKYSWIAYFEMAGFLHDTGVLENWAERTSSVDIDPSFPTRVANERIVDTDNLGDQAMDMKDWMNSGPPNLSPYLRLRNLRNQLGPWVALDGFFSQEDKTRCRNIFCFIRSFLVNNEVTTSLLEHLSRQSFGGRWLPEKPSVYYTFAGEIPWCETFPDEGTCEFQFVVKEKPVKVQRNNTEIHFDDEKPANSVISIELRDVTVEVEEMQKEYVKYDVFMPVHDFRWESYHSLTNDAGHATTLAKKIATELDLFGQPQTFDLFASSGKRATYNIHDKYSDIHNGQSMFYVEEDLLKKYLQVNGLTLIWAIWGERSYSSNIVSQILDDSGNAEQKYKTFSRIERYE